MNCKCIIATDGCAEPFILIDGKWSDLINLKFICPKCKVKVTYSNSKIYEYPNMSDIDIKNK